MDYIIIGLALIAIVIFFVVIYKDKTQLKNTDYQIGILCSLILLFKSIAYLLKVDSLISSSIVVLIGILFFYNHYKKKKVYNKGNRMLILVTTLFTDVTILFGKLGNIFVEFQDLFGMLGVIWVLLCFVIMYKIFVSKE